MQLGILKTFKIRGFFWKNRFFFRKKTLKLFKTANCGKFFLKCVSSGIISSKCLSTLFLRFFWLKLRKYSKLEFMINKKCILKKKTLSSFWKASLTMLEGAKYPRGSRVSCWKFHWQCDIQNYTANINDTDKK